MQVAPRTGPRCAFFNRPELVATYDVPGVWCLVVAEYEAEGHHLCASCLFNTSIAFTKRWRRIGTLDWRIGYNIIVPDPVMRWPHHQRPSGHLDPDALTRRIE